MRIPHQHPLIPAGRCQPAAGTEQTPIDARGELGVAVHDAKLGTDGNGVRSKLLLGGRAVGPDADRHVVTGAGEHIASVGTPRQAADGVLVAGKNGGWSAGRVAQVEGADDTVDACRSDDRVAVLVPVVRQNFRWHGTAEGLACREEWQRGPGPLRRRMGRDDGRQVVLGRHWCAQVEDANVRVGRDARDDGGVGRREAG